MLEIRRRSRMMDRRSIAKKWYDEVQKPLVGTINGQNLSSVFQFMAYWMAFNCLYSGNTSDCERKQIEDYIEKCDQTLQAFNAFSATQNIKEILSKPVVDTRYDIFGSKYSSLKGDEAVQFLQQQSNDRNRISFERSIRNYSNLKLCQNTIIGRTALLLTIYQIRCNLFHGDKNPMNDRDCMLVKEAAYVMKNYLDVLFKENRSSAR